MGHSRKISHAKASNSLITTYDLVRSVVSADNLLKWHPKDGCEPLCTFPDKPVSSTSFPRSNEAGILKRKAGDGCEGSICALRESRSKMLVLQRLTLLLVTAP